MTGVCLEDKGLWRVIKYSRGYDKKTRDQGHKVLFPCYITTLIKNKVKETILECNFFCSNVEHSASISLKYTRVNNILFISYLKCTSKILNLLFVLKVDVAWIGWNLVIKHEFILTSRLLISNFLSWCNILSTHITPMFH